MSACEVARHTMMHIMFDVWKITVFSNPLFLEMPDIIPFNIPS